VVNEINIDRIVEDDTPVENSRADRYRKLQQTRQQPAVQQLEYALRTDYIAPPKVSQTEIPTKLTFGASMDGFIEAIKPGYAKKQKCKPITATIPPVNVDCNSRREVSKPEVVELDLDDPQPAKTGECRSKTVKFAEPEFTTINQSTMAALQKAINPTKVASRQVPSLHSNQPMNPPACEKAKKRVLRLDDINLDCTTRFKIDQ
jgi:hypothetical protein